MPPPRPPLLHLVAGRDSSLELEVAKARLAQGDDPNMREDEDGLTPLHVACHWDNLAMVQLLLLHGGDVWREDDHGRTPIGLATGETKKFLERMRVRTEPERRSIFQRIAHLHFGSRIGKAFKGARKKMRRTLGAILPAQRRRAESECNNPVVISTSTPNPSIGGSTTASYCTADEGESRRGRRRSSLVPPHPAPSGPSAPASSGLLVLDWKRPVTPPTTNQVEIEWRKGLEKEESTVKKKEKREERERSGEGKVTVRKKKGTPKKTKENGDDDWRPLESEDEGEGEGERRVETGDGTAKKQRTPRGLRKKVEEMDEGRLRSELRWLGIDAGPIARGGNVRKMYEKRLIETLMMGGDDEKIKRIIDGAPPPSTSTSKLTSTTPSSKTIAMKNGGGTGGGVKTVDSSQGQKYSRPLELAIGGRAWQEGEAQGLDEKIRALFMNKGVSAFCYLLLDPRRLPLRAEEITMGQFIDAIFYVGKGTKARPHQHLIDARNAKDNPQMRRTDKIDRILDIWASGTGVVSLQLSFNICDEEALTREGSLIESIGLRNLTNVQGGKFYGGVAHWLPLQRAQLGTLMLKRARLMLHADPSSLRPIRPEALPEALFRMPPGGLRKAAPVMTSSPKPPPGMQNRLRAVT